MEGQRITVDGNEAAARIAHLTNEVIAIYPITPASPMGELCDVWSSRDQKNLWGMVPRVIELQSEGGAAGAVHGSLQAGALTTTFTASQGLLLMLPNMFKIAGELTPAVIHVAARAVATHALSIFGDHSDVMAARSTGWGMLCSSSVQEAHDFALIAQMATLRSRVPFVHFFDGFRTSHELNQVLVLSEDDVRALLPHGAIEEFRSRSLNPDRPVLRGSAQNPDVFFQAREACEPYYAATSRIVVECLDDFAKRTGRSYKPFDYVGAEDAESVIVLMGSGVHAAEEAVEELNAHGEKMGCIKVRLYRPFDVDAFRAALPKSVRAITVLDRTKEPGSSGEPLYQDVVTALMQTHGEGPLPSVKGGRYGLGQKEFTPAMAAAALRAAHDDSVKHSFTVGIEDDVSNSSLTVQELPRRQNEELTQALFYGLGSDGTVGATKSSVKIIAQDKKSWAQGYFVYDSKKSGSVTVSHLRFGKRPIERPYEIDRAEFIACHQFSFLERIDVLERAASGATVLLNSPHPADELWQFLPKTFQEKLLRGEHRLFVIDADKVAEDAGLGRRINTVMQTCFFSLSGLLDRSAAVAAVKESIERAYGRMGQSVVERNQAAVDAALDALAEVELSDRLSEGRDLPDLVPVGAPDFVRELTAPLMAGRGDALPVSALPVDGTFPTGTAKWERRSIAREIPIWDPDICIQCGLCALVCPHASIRVKTFPTDVANGVTPWREGRGKELSGQAVTIQVAPDDCTGCRVCVDVCPAFMKEKVSHKAINMEPKSDHLERERERWDAFLQLPESDRSEVDTNSVKGSQRLQPLFEFSGACAGCGETPYLKLLSQLFGERAVIANATGCSSIYGGNLPTTPWTQNADGRGPAWSNSLFEDNAEFGLGMRLALDQQRELARKLLAEFREQLDSELVDALLEDIATDEGSLAKRREQLGRLKDELKKAKDSRALALLGVCDTLLPRTVWIVGGDGWAYDIGFGGLDHVLASSLDVNILVLDTEVYSNTGGQASKATPLGAVAKFASGGKDVTKKDLGMVASAYGNVYVAQIAMGANPAQTVKAFHEAESHRGPSILIAYSTCIAHGIDMSQSMARQKEAVKAGFWPLYRSDPRQSAAGKPALQLDSRKPKISFRDFAMKEARFAMLYRKDREASQRLMQRAQEGIDQRWHLYEQLALVNRNTATEEEEKS